MEVHPKMIDIQNGNSGIAKAMRSQQKKFHKVIVGITDMDKKNIPDYFSHFIKESDPDDIILKRYPESNQYLIFLCCPAIENWLLQAAASVGVEPEDFQLPSKLKEFCRLSKSQNVLKDRNFMDFIREIKKREAMPFKYLKEIIERLLLIDNRTIAKS